MALSLLNKTVGTPSTMRFRSAETGRFVKGLQERVLDEAEDAFSDVMREAAEDLQKELSVPVVRPPARGIRSLPGQYPRMDTQELKLSVTWVVYRAKGKLRGTVETHTRYDRALNKTRPFKRLHERKWKSRIEERLRAALNR